MRALDIGLAVGFLLAAQAFAIAAAVLNYRMAVEVNLKLPAADQISELGWNWGKYIRVRRLHRILYPDAALVRKIKSCFVLTWIMGLAFLVSFWKSGLLR